MAPEANLRSIQATGFLSQNEKAGVQCLTKFSRDKILMLVVISIFKVLNDNCIYIRYRFQVETAMFSMIATYSHFETHFQHSW